MATAAATANASTSAYSGHQTPQEASRNQDTRRQDRGGRGTRGGRTRQGRGRGAGEGRRTTFQLNVDATAWYPSPEAEQQQQGQQQPAAEDRRRRAQPRDRNREPAAARRIRRIQNDQQQQQPQSGTESAHEESSAEQQQSPGETSRPPRRRRQNRAARSEAATSAEDESLRASLTKSLIDGTCECAICYESIKPRQSVWSCGVCYGVLHLFCTQKWARKSLAAQREAGATAQTLQAWRCPGCNSSASSAVGDAAVPGTYACFCGKSVDPQFTRYLTPHTCGQTCGKQLACGRHTCMLPCHPGPCDTCAEVVPGGVACFCGKQSVPAVCGDERIGQGWSCGGVCEELLACGKHTCASPCHDGLCPPCAVLDSQRCYCGKHHRQVPCSTKQADAVPTPAQFTDCDDKADIRFYSCDDVCGIAFTCGEHTCDKACHPLRDHDHNGGLTPCPYLPEKWATCPCGACTQAELSGNPEGRRTCTDPVLTCGGVCGKLLLTCSTVDGVPQQHTCPLPCHLGECRPCEASVSVRCRCGCGTVELACSQVSLLKEPPLCERVCKSSRLCGRHECNVKCCPLLSIGSHDGSGSSSNGGGSGGGNKKKKNSNRQKLSFAAFATHQDGGSAAETSYLETIYHTCTLACNRPLKCGTADHRCTLPCHSGACPPCLQASFDDLYCACGSTRIQAPVPCGTKPPLCTQPCTRVRACDHTTGSAHNCHPDDVPCPPCVVLTTRPCLCGKKEVRGIPCFRKDTPSCGLVCEKILPCGAHRCRRGCHTGPCLPPVPGSAEEEADAIRSCTQACGKKRACGHPCPATCHAPYACPAEPDAPCPVKIRVRCQCKSLEEAVLCGQAAQLPSEEGTRRPMIPCTDACKLLERNRRLAAAFNLRPERAETLPDTSASHLPDYNIWILDYAYANHPFAKMVETTLGDFVQRQQQKQQDQDTGSTGLRLRPVVSDSVYFPPMKAAARRFVHEYVTFWDLEAQSMDVEPNRSVMVSRSAGKEPKVPAVLVTVAASLHAKHNVPIVNVSTPVGTASSDQESDTNAAPKPRKATAAVNALLLVGVSPELTMLDIESYVRSYFSPVKFETRWHEESGCLLLPDTRTVAIYDMEPFLKRIRGSLKPVLVNAGKVNDIRLAWVTSDGTVCGPGGKRPDATAGGKTGGVEQPEKTVRKPANAFAQLEQLGELSLSDV